MVTIIHLFLVITYQNKECTVLLKNEDYVNKIKCIINLLFCFYHRMKYCEYMYLYEFGSWLWCLRHFQRYFSYLVVVSFIGGRNRSTQRQPPTCRISLTNFYHKMLYRVHLSMSVIKIAFHSCIIIYIYTGPSWSWWYCSWIYNYLCNQCLSSLKVVSLNSTLMERCTRYNILW
jgi:hypothetical protein